MFIHHPYVMLAPAYVLVPRGHSAPSSSGKGKSYEYVFHKKGLRVVVWQCVSGGESPRIQHLVKVFDVNARGDEPLRQIGYPSEALSPSASTEEGLAKERRKLATEAANKVKP
jgi:hypothetical protein